MYMCMCMCMHMHMLHMHMYMYIMGLLPLGVDLCMQSVHGSHGLARTRTDRTDRTDHTDPTNVIPIMKYSFTCLPANYDFTRKLSAVINLYGH